MFPNPQMYLAWTIVGVLVIVVQTALWLIFSRKLVGLCFPKESDQSFFRFFTCGRLKFLTIVQGAIMIGLFFLTTYIAW